MTTPAPRTAILIAASLADARLWHEPPITADLIVTPRTLDRLRGLVVTNITITDAAWELPDYARRAISRAVDIASATQGAALRGRLQRQLWRFDAGARGTQTR